jgi:methylated-DNA-[protein]-cysteine S-methyltransferase
MKGEVRVQGLGLRMTAEDGRVVDVELLPFKRKSGSGSPVYKLPEGPGKAFLKKALTEAAGYLAGKRRRFTVPFEQKHATAFHEKVYKALMDVPYGHVVSYGELARLAGAPRAARAVGSAMKRNRLCLLVPCHRVVASNGLGGYNGQLEWKKALLDLEREHSGGV